MSDETVAIEYVGNKPFSVDNVAGTGICWHGKGDIQDVPVSAAETLLKYPDQWATADGKPLAPSKVADTAPKTSAVEKMNATQLRQYAKTQHGVTFKVGMKTEQIRKEVHGLDLQQLDQGKA
jgi:hypothetical protein